MVDAAQGELGNVSKGILNPNYRRPIESLVPPKLEQFVVQERAERFGQNFRKMVTAYEAISVVDKDYQKSFPRKELLGGLINMTKDPASIKPEQKTQAEKEIQKVKTLMKGCNLTDEEEHEMKETISMCGNELSATFISMLIRDDLESWEKTQNKGKDDAVRDRMDGLKTRFATYQQKMAYALYRAGVAPQSEISKRMMLHDALVKQIAKTGDKSITQNPDFFINAGRTLVGVKTEAAIIECLSRTGHIVYIPDWESKDDIQLFDRMGVDLIMINKKGEIVCVDAKTQSSSRDGSLPKPGMATKEVERDFTMEFDKIKNNILMSLIKSKEHPAKLQAIIDTALEKQDVRIIKFFVPGSYTSHDPFGRVRGVSDQQEMLTVIDQINGK